MIRFSLSAANPADEVFGRHRANLDVRIKAAIIGAVSTVLTAAIAAGVILW
jgi:hypothetical protein